MSTDPVLVLNGPNLNLLGVREPDIYGTANYDELVSFCTTQATTIGLEIEIRQTNSESQMIDWVQAAAKSRTPIVINPAAFTHYSYALRDAVAACTAPVIEVHISNPFAREHFRHTSVISGVATGTITGFGFNSYALALIEIAKRHP